MEGKNKKIIFAVLLVLFLAIPASIFLLGYHKGIMMRYVFQEKDNKISSRTKISSALETNFTTPQDAMKSGQIVARVNDIESAENKVTEIALQNDGKIYETNISYSAKKAKDAIIVLQVPVEKFEVTFEAVRTLGVDVIRESTRQMPLINNNVVLGPVADVNGTNVPEDEVVKAEVVQSAVKTDEEAIQGSPEAQGSLEPQKTTYQQAQTQNKGYIRVILANYQGENISDYVRNQNCSGMMFFQNNSQDFSGAMWIAIGIKIALLVAMFGLLIYLSIRMVVSFHKYRIHKKTSNTKASAKKAVVHVIRKIPRARVVRKKL